MSFDGSQVRAASPKDLKIFCCCDGCGGAPTWQARSLVLCTSQHSRGPQYPKLTLTSTPRYASTPRSFAPCPSSYLSTPRANFPHRTLLVIPVPNKRLSLPPLTSSFRTFSIFRNGFRLLLRFARPSNSFPLNHMRCETRLAARCFSCCRANG